MGRAMQLSPYRWWQRSFAFCASLATLSIGLAAQSPMQELVAGVPNTLESPPARETPLALVERARQNLYLDRNGSPPFVLKMTLQADGTVPYTGAGTWDEYWIDGQHWYYTAHLGSVTLDRYAGVLSTNPDGPMPLRVEMARSALLRPIPSNTLSSSSIRLSKVAWRNAELDCFLFAPAQYKPPDMGRGNVETEYCFDPATSLMRIWSPLPGVYYLYDYTGGPVFEDHKLPHSIEVTQGSQIVLKVTVQGMASIESVPPTPPGASRSFGMLTPPVVQWQRWQFPADWTGPQQDTTVLVHALVGPDQKLRELELVGDSDPGLLQLVRTELSGQYPGGRGRGGAQPAPNERELYFGVVFTPNASAAPPVLPPVAPLAATPTGPFPYEGTQITSTTQTLADGNIIEHSTRTLQARDSHGRTYHENVSNTGASSPERTYSVTDPSARISLQVWPQRSFAEMRSMSAAGAGGIMLPPLPGGQPATIPQPNRIVPTEESLGDQLIQGITVSGTRTTTVYPAGSVGNRDPMTVIREVWRTRDGFIWESMTDDPRNGVTTVEWQDFQVGEPDVQLFTIPPSYTVVDQNGNPVKPPNSGG